jgi:predicted nucleic-acid-binding Zn-ribbon protein
MKKEMPSFAEWSKTQKCKKCDCSLDLSFSSYMSGGYKKVVDVDGEKVRGMYCGDCGDMAQAELMNSRFIENYNGATIFGKDGNYVPYWGSFYYFKTIEECRIRIDAKNIAVLPFGIVNLSEVLG